MTVPEAPEVGMRTHLLDHVVLAKRANRIICPRADHGGAFDGTTDDTAAWQAAIAAAKSSKIGTTIVFPNRPSKVTGIEVDDVQGLRILGYGHQSKFVWGGDSSTPLLHVTNSRDCEFGGFVIRPGAACATAIHMERDQSSGVTTPTLDWFHDIWMQGDSGYIGTGIKIGDTVDANNDFGHFDRVSVRNYATQAFQLGGTQSYGNRFTNCHGHGYGSATTYGLRCSHGYYTWQGGFLGNNAADFYHTGYGYGQPRRIIDVVSEGSKRLLESTYGSYGNGVFEIDGARWAANNPHADRKVIKITRAHHVSIRRCTLGNHTLAAGALVDVTAAESFHAEQNSFMLANPEVLTFDPWAGIDPTFSRGNVAFDELTLTPTALPNIP